MSRSSTVVIQRRAATRQRLAWPMLVVGMLLTWMMFAATLPASATPVGTALAPQVVASPDGGCPPELPDLVAISEAKVETLRSPQPRGMDTPPLLMPTLASPASTFVAATSTTLLQHAVLSTRRYPPAPYLRLNPGHAPPLA